MSDSALRSGSEGMSSDWRIREASGEDAGAVARAVAQLLEELGGQPPTQEAMQRVAAELIDDPALGAVLVAEADRALVGVLAASWQSAIHAAGSYAIVQDLWVAPRWRSRSVGASLLAGMVGLARARSMRRIEVGLPSSSFERLPATEAFYLTNGFERQGPRMRKTLQ
jgi:GNAT superfamily N-acetyltransferase